MTESPLLEAISSIGIVGLIVALLFLPVAAFKSHRVVKTRSTLFLLASSTLLASTSAAQLATLHLFHMDFFQSRPYLARSIGNGVEAFIPFFAACTALSLLAFVFRSRKEA